MKKIVCIILSLAISLSLIAQNKEFKIVASASMIADMAENIIAGEDETITTIVPIGGDPHLHEPTPNDAKLVANADLILINGLTFEGWIDKLIESSGTKAKVVTVTDGLTPISSDDYQNATDPHAWMDVSNVHFYIKNIKDALVEMRPENKEMYEFNHGVYTQTLNELDTYVTTQIQTIPEAKRILVTSHDAFKYFGRRYGIRLESIIGVSTEAEAQTTDIVRLNKVIKESGIPAIFGESTINTKMLEQLAEGNDIQLGGKLYADSLGPKDSDGGTYVCLLYTSPSPRDS